MDPSLISLIGLAISIGIPILSAAVSIIICGTALAGIGTEKPELLSRLIITVVLGEALAIYGLLIAFMLLGKLPNITTMEAANKALISGIIISVATVSAGVGISYSGSSLIAATAGSMSGFLLNCWVTASKSSNFMFSLSLSF